MNESNGKFKVDLIGWLDRPLTKIEMLASYISSNHGSVTYQINVYTICVISHLYDMYMTTLEKGTGMA